MLKRNVEELAELFEPRNEHLLPVFSLALTFDDEKIEMYPTSQDLEEQVLGILNSITNTMQVRSRVIATQNTIWCNVIVFRATNDKHVC